MRQLEIRRLGRVSYADALALQKQLVEERRTDAIVDQLLLLEHPHVITLGVNTKSSWQHVLASPDRLKDEHVEVHETGRGGDVTYHGPGQVVGYPVLDLRPDRCDVHKYVRDLEEVLIRAAGRFGIQAGRVSGLTGVWVEGRKLAAIGVRISRWITSHGFAFNVGTDLRFFDLIVPCGIADRGVSSLEKLLGGPVSVPEVELALSEEFCQVFERTTNDSGQPDGGGRRVSPPASLMSS